MILDRLEMLSAISFVEPAIPKKAETGRNCIFIRQDEDKLILTGGNEFIVKKAVLLRQNSTDDVSGVKKPLPKMFMIPVADLMAFKEMMEGHKVDCKKLAKNDPSHLFVEINLIEQSEKKGTIMEMISYDGKVIFQQPRYEFKDLETFFQIKKEAVTDIPVMQGDITSALKGFMKSKQVEITFSGVNSWIHFGQGDYEAIVLPSSEKEEEDESEGIQTTIDGKK